MANHSDVRCSICSTPIDHEPAADHRVYKGGELAYIELAHRRCAEQEDPAFDFWRVA